jgi:hypothetical protein
MVFLFSAEGLGDPIGSSFVRIASELAQVTDVVADAPAGAIRLVQHKKAGTKRYL